MTRIRKNGLLFFLLITGIVTPCFADIAIIVNPENSARLDEAQVRNIFLGKVKIFDNGLPAVPIEIEPGDPVRKEFKEIVLHKTEANLNAYWVRMLFSSKAEPPRRVKNSAEVKAMVAADKSAIGYVDVKSLDQSVKVLFVIP